MSKADPASFNKDIIQDISLRAPDFYLNIYMSEVDKDIVENNLRGGVVGGYIDDETHRLISQVLDTITFLPLNPGIEAQAHEDSRKLSIYDSRRLESAFQHGVSLITCDPLHFTVCSNERDHIRRFGYADVCIGDSESDPDDSDSIKSSTKAKVWVFSPKALSLLLRHPNVDTLRETDRAEMLSLINYKTTSDLQGSTAEVVLRLNNETITGTATNPGAIDAILRAIENAVSSHVELEESNVYLAISDTTSTNDFVQIYLRLYLQEHQFEATDESLNTLSCAARAYTRAINAALRFLA